MSAWGVWASLQSPPPACLAERLADLQGRLESHEHWLPVRSAWLARVAVARLGGVDVLGLARTRDRLAAAATVLDAGPGGDLGGVLADLAGRGVRRLMVEGGSEVLAGFLGAGLADELLLAVAPLFVGDAGAPRFLGVAGRARARLVDVRPVGDMALLRYALSDRAS
jgi:riboflavin biosynthesis pyrimidine reductase